MDAPAPAQEPSIADGILDAHDGLDVNDRNDAGTLADQVIDRVIIALQRDQRMPKLSRIAFELLLGDARRDIERDIGDLIDGTVNLDDVSDAIEEASTEASS